MLGEVQARHSCVGHNNDARCEQGAMLLFTSVSISKEPVSVLRGALAGKSEQADLSKRGHAPEQRGRLCHVPLRPFATPRPRTAHHKDGGVRWQRGRALCEEPSNTGKAQTRHSPLAHALLSHALEGSLQPRRNALRPDGYHGDAGLATFQSVIPPQCARARPPRHRSTHRAGTSAPSVLPICPSQMLASPRLTTC